MQILLRDALALACTVLLSACHGSNVGINPPPAPTPDQISKSDADFESVWNAIKSSVAQDNPSETNLDNVTAQRFVAAGYYLTARGCDEFFKQNRNLRNDTGFVKDLAVSASSASGFIAGLSGAAINVLTGFLGATGIIPGVVNNFDKTFLISDIADSIYAPVMSGMKNYRSTNPPDSATRLNALERVAEHARFCTVSSMLDIAKAKLSSTTVVVLSEIRSGQPPAAPQAGVRTFAVPQPQATTGMQCHQNGAFLIC
jgi:hypothetical protein